MFLLPTILKLIISLRFPPHIHIYIELQGRLIPKVLESDRGAVIKFFKQRNYCFPKQIVSGRSLPH